MQNRLHRYTRTDTIATNHAKRDTYVTVHVHANRDTIDNVTDAKERRKEVNYIMIYH